ncbi:MAG TPA: hypothetical protein PKH31_11145 [Candidatus Sumerlaeota bacterium]|nr:hypothetical protein [Candidatus Sumerlaeota bacterium]
MWRTPNPRRRTAVLALFLVLSGLVGTLTLASQQNGAGGVLRSISTESASAVPALTNTAGATLLLAGTDQASVDTANGTGAHLYIGLLDPLGPSDPVAPPAHVPQLLIY